MNEELPSDPGIKTYVIRAGRMTEAQKKALDSLSPRYCIPYAEHLLDPLSAFGRIHPLVMEIGFGMGQATWRIAVERPEYDYLGVEVHAPGVGRLLMEIERLGIENLRIIQHDAVQVLSTMIADSSLAGFHIFYPDPWPKKRHHKRRLMRPALVDLMICKLALGGYLYFVTDIEEYAVAAREVLDGFPSLENEYQGFAERISWRPETKFEARAKSQAPAGGSSAYELFYRKVDSHSKKELNFR
jgi:tRNA (guanine-N7-)-methyltransferase